MSDIVQGSMLVRTKDSFRGIPAFVIYFDEPVWNVIVFLILNLLAFPVLEFLSDQLVRKTATMKLLKDERFLLSDSNMGILSLYSTYYGRRRGLMIMIFVGLMAIVMETFAEFCSSSTQLSEKTRIDVWKINDTHPYSYIYGGEQNSEHAETSDGGAYEHLRVEKVSLREERVESVLDSQDCIFGDEPLVLRLNESATRNDFEPVVRAHYMNVQLSSSRLFLASDNRSIVCDYFRTRPEQVEVWMPAVGHENGTFVSAPARHIALRTRSRPAINWWKRIKIGKSWLTAYGFRIGEQDLKQSEEDSYTCLQVHEEDDCRESCESVACAIYAIRNSTFFFGFAEGSVISSEQRQIVDVRRWRMEFKHDLRGKERRKLLQLDTLPEQTVRFVVRMYLEGYIWATENEEVERKRVETMSRYVLSISSESLVNGQLRQVESRFIQPRLDMVRQVPTVTVLAAIPLLLFLVIVVVQLLLLRRIENKIGMRKKTRGVMKGAAKVETSMQWFRGDFVRLLKANGYRAELSDISLRLVSADGKTRLSILRGLDSSTTG